MSHLNGCGKTLAELSVPACENGNPASAHGRGLKMPDVIMMSVKIAPLILEFRVAVCYIPSTSYFSVTVRNISSLFLMEE